MTFIIEIQTNHAAFADRKSFELVRILRRLADQLDGTELSARDIPRLKRYGWPLWDVNGNLVGTVWESR